MSHASKKLLLIGRGGFLGSRLWRHLEKSNPLLECSAVSRSDMDLADPDSAGRLRGYLDVNTSVVWSAFVKRHVDDSPFAFEKNLAITLNLLRVFEAAPPRHLVFLSSAAVYGEFRENHAITEETPLDPVTHYGLAKCVAERLLQMWAGRHPQTRLLILRPSLVDGPGNLKEPYRPSGFVRCLRAGDPIMLWGDGNELRDFVWVEDVCRVIDLALKQELTGVYNLASEEPMSFRAAAQLFAALAGRPELLKERLRTGDRVSQTFTGHKLLRNLKDFSFTSPAIWLNDLWKVV